MSEQPQWNTPAQGYSSRWYIPDCLFQNREYTQAVQEILDCLDRGMMITAHHLDFEHRDPAETGYYRALDMAIDRQADRKEVERMKMQERYKRRHLRVVPAPQPDHIVTAGPDPELLARRDQFGNRIWGKELTEKDFQRTRRRRHHET